MGPGLRRDDGVMHSRASSSTVIARAAAIAPSAVVTPSAIIARLDRAIQYAAASRSFTDASGRLDPRFRGDDDL